MFFTIIKLWHTMNGEYHSTSVDRSNFDAAVGEFHAMFKPMQNDNNVKSFVLMVVDDHGAKIEKCSWERKAEDGESGILDR